MATLDEVMSGTKDAMTVRRVFGEPLERGGLTFIPVAKVGGGGGGGEGQGQQEPGAPMGQGSGGGFGVTAKPVGAYVISGDKVEWRPSVDATKLAVGGMMLAGLLAVVVRSIISMRD